MFRRYALGFSNVGRQFSTMGSATPLEDAIRAKVCDFSVFQFASLHFPFFLHPAFILLLQLFILMRKCLYNSLTFIPPLDS